MTNRPRHLASVKNSIWFIISIYGPFGAMLDGHFLSMFPDYRTIKVMKKRSKILFAILLSLFAGAAVAAFMCYVGASDNSQGEFIDNTKYRVDIIYFSITFLSWTIPISAICFATYTASVALISLLRRRMGKTPSLR